jgi:hypothetical protein
MPLDRPVFVLGPMSREFPVPTRIGFGSNGYVPDAVRPRTGPRAEAGRSGDRPRCCTAGRAGEPRRPGVASTSLTGVDHFEPTMQPGRVLGHDDNDVPGRAEHRGAPSTFGAARPDSTAPNQG